MSTEEMYEQLKAKLRDVVPDAELRIQAGIAAEINRLKQERNAVILGHNYMEPALFHSIPDYVGDSLELSRVAARTTADIIVFCGVKFMAETAKILNPAKTVLIPSLKAGCSLAASITAEDVRQLKARYPGVPVVTYVNTYADVKAESDICCTSGNAQAVIESLNAETIIFLPDEYLARNVAKETGRHIIFPTKTARAATDIDYHVIASEAKQSRTSGAEIASAQTDAPAQKLARGCHSEQREESLARPTASPVQPRDSSSQKHAPRNDTAAGNFLPSRIALEGWASRNDLPYQLIGWHGRCEVHEQFTVQDIETVRAQFPDVMILAHPECSPEVVEASDYSGSTTAMIKYVEQTNAPRYLLLTECSMGDNILAAHPEKEMLRLCMVRCPHMNQISLEMTRQALQKTQYVVDVPEEIRVRAYRAVERMIQIGGKVTR